MLRASRLLAAAAALPLLAGCSTVTVNGNAVRTPEAPVIAAMTQPVRTQQGLVHGVSSRIEGVTVFRGIPFAAPPVGDLRWQPPQAPVSWSGVRDASQYGAPCIQTPAPQRFPVNPATDLGNAPPPSEDCLFLNIWTPAQAAGEKLPVMVWLFGGAYNEGGGNAPFSEGDNLAAKGVVLVTLNYRVGSLGFFSHPELSAESPHGASGNQGLADAIAAFKWLKANVAAFGGDPGNITLFGESAGAAMNAGLVGSPVAAGTFERAIAESGGWMGLGIATMMPKERAEAMGKQMAEAAGAPTLAELRAMPAADVHAKIRGQGMVVDGWIIPEDLSITFAQGRQNKVDVIAGSNGDEGSFTSAFGPPPTLESWNNGAAMRWDEHVDLGNAAYPASTDEEAAAQAPMPFSDTLAWHMRLFADRQAAIGQDAWHYWFTHEPPYDDDRADLGSAHTAEIPYVFDNLAAPRTFPGGSSVEKMAGNPREEALADLVSSYWVNFARTGNPNGPGLPYWPRMGELRPNETMILDADGSGRGPWLTESKTALYEALYKDRVEEALRESE